MNVNESNFDEWLQRLKNECDINKGECISTYNELTEIADTLEAEGMPVEARKYKREAEKKLNGILTEHQLKN